MSLQPIALCNLTTTLILDGISDYSESVVRETLLKLRLAGGHIHGHGRIMLCEYDDIVRKTGNGFFLKERFDLLAKSGPDDRMDAMLRALSKPMKEEPWLMPMNLGYLPLTASAKRKGSRGNHPHAYAEPLVGLVQYVPKRNLEENGESIPFWGYASGHGAFLAKQLNQS